MVNAGAIVISSLIKVKIYGLVRNALTVVI